MPGSGLPTLSALTPAPGPQPASLDELVYDPKRSRSRAQAEQRSEEELLQECTFNPSINRAAPRTPWA